MMHFEMEPLQHSSKLKTKTSMTEKEFIRPGRAFFRKTFLPLLPLKSSDSLDF